MAAPQITPLPPAGQRNEPESEFIPKMNAFVAALEPHRVELQAQADFVDSKATIAENSATRAETSEALALSAGNYAGKWSELSGSLTQGSSVFHNQEYWGLLDNLSDITLSEPSIGNTNWQRITIDQNTIAETYVSKASVGSAAYYDVGTTPSQIPTNANLGTAATKDVGTAANQITLNSDLGTAPAILDSRRRAVEAASGGRNTIIYDAQGNENDMVIVPRFNYEDTGLAYLGTGTPTAFLTNGVPRSEILVGKYQASTATGGTAVVAGAVPRTSVNFDTAKSLCTSKGAGWHLMNNHEWAAIAWASIAMGTVPRGNTYYGQSHINKFETGILAGGGVPGDAGTGGVVKTGSGPAAWTHDGTKFGIHDLVGNVWEWMDLFKIVDGQIITTLDNNPDLDEASWPSHAAFYDNNILNSQRVTAGVRTSIKFESLTKDPSYVSNELLKRLLIEPAGSGLDGRLYMNSEGEILPFRGGLWFYGSSAGLASLYLNDSRSVASSNIGFRPAFFTS